MAGKCKEMNKIKQALRLHLDGESKENNIIMVKNV